MIKTRLLKSLLLLLCFVLVAAVALFATGCNSGDEPSIKKNGGFTPLGEGETVFLLSVIDADNVETAFEIHTDKTTVGDALIELGLISGEEGPYGLYIKSVNGITADFNTDGTYWAFYIGSEYAMTGVDQTDITEGETYSLKVEK